MAYTEPSSGQTDPWVGELADFPPPKPPRGRLRQVDGDGFSRLFAVAAATAAVAAANSQLAPAVTAEVTLTRDRPAAAPPPPPSPAAADRVDGVTRDLLREAASSTSSPPLEKIDAKSPRQQQLPQGEPPKPAVRRLRQERNELHDNGTGDRSRAPRRGHSDRPNSSLEKRRQAPQPLQAAAKDIITQRRSFNPYHDPQQQQQRQLLLPLWPKSNQRLANSLAREPAGDVGVRCRSNSLPPAEHIRDVQVEHALPPAPPRRQSAPNVPAARSNTDSVGRYTSEGQTRPPTHTGCTKQWVDSSNSPRRLVNAGATTDLLNGSLESLAVASRVHSDASLSEAAARRSRQAMSPNVTWLAASRSSSAGRVDACLTRTERNATSGSGQAELADRSGVCRDDSVYQEPTRTERLTVQASPGCSQRTAQEPPPGESAPTEAPVRPRRSRRSQLSSPQPALLDGATGIKLSVSSPSRPVRGQPTDLSGAVVPGTSQSTAVHVNRANNLQQAIVSPGGSSVTCRDRVTARPCNASTGATNQGDRIEKSAQPAVNRDLFLSSPPHGAGRLTAAAGCDSAQWTLRCFETGTAGEEPTSASSAVGSDSDSFSVHSATSGSHGSVTSGCTYVINGASGHERDDSEGESTDVGGGRRQEALAADPNWSRSRTRRGMAKLLTRVSNTWERLDRAARRLEGVQASGSRRALPVAADISRPVLVSRSDEIFRATDPESPGGRAR